MEDTPTPAPVVPAGPSLEGPVVIDPGIGLMQEGPIRYFQDARIQTSIDSAISAMLAKNPDAHGMVIAHADPKGFGGTASIMGKLGPGQWTVVVGAYKPMHQKFAWETSAQYSW